MNLFSHGACDSIHRHSVDGEGVVAPGGLVRMQSLTEAGVGMMFENHHRSGCCRAGGKDFSRVKICASRGGLSMKAFNLHR